MNTLFKKPWLIIVFIMLITGFFSYQIPKLKINNELEIFLPDNHNSKILKNKMEETYGSSEVMSIGIKTKNGSVISIEAINVIKNIIEDVEKINNIKEAKGITNTDFVDGTAEGMSVAELVKNIPETDADVEQIKEKLLSWELYKGNLYSNDLKSTQILVKLKKDISIKDKEKIYYEVKDILKKYKTENIEFHLAGNPVITVLLGTNMVGDMTKLIPFVVLVVVLSLYLSFKNLGGVILPLLTVAISTICTMGFMAMLGISLTMVSTVIPVLLVAVGSAYGIHIISHYYDDLKSTKGEISEHEHREIVFETVRKVGKPVFLAGLTTIGGFGSLATSTIIPMKYFGIFTAVGVTNALVVALLLIPSILLIRHKSLKISKKEEEKEGMLTRVLIWSFHYFGRKKIRIVVFAGFISIISIIGTSKIIVDGPLIEMFKPSSELRMSDKYLNDNFNGTTVLNVLIDGNGKGSLADPEILKSMDNLKSYLKSNYEYVGQVTSFADFIKRMNKVMNYPQEENNNMGIDNLTEVGTDSLGTDENSGGSDSFVTESNENSGNNSFLSGADTENNTDVIENTSMMESKPEEKLSAEPETKDMLKLINKAVLSADKLNLSAEELIELVNKEVNYKGAAYNEIPYNPSKYAATDKAELKNLISQYLLLYSGNLDEFINDQLEPSKTKMMIQLKDQSNIATHEIEKAVKKYADENFPKGYTVSFAGNADMSLAVNNLIVKSQIMSIISSIIIVFVIVAISYKSSIAGLYGIIPLILSLLINFGLMGYTGIKLDIGTAMVASIAIGIGVDYTIHFLSTYNYERKKSDDLEEVTKRTLVSSGKAIIFNAVSVAAGFAVLMFSNFVPLVNLGLLISITMLTSSLASMTLLPALLNLFKPKFIKK